MPKQPIIKTERGEEFEFVFALHINDLVSIDVDGKRQIYRIQKLDSAGSRLMLRLHTAASLDIKDEEIFASISKLMKMNLLLTQFNSIGKLLDD